VYKDVRGMLLGGGKDMSVDDEARTPCFMES